MGLSFALRGTRLKIGSNQFLAVKICTEINHLNKKLNFSYPSIYQYSNLIRSANQDRKAFEKFQKMVKWTNIHIEIVNTDCTLQ